MSGVLKSAISKRVQGEKPSVLQAMLVALVAGIAAAVLTYRLMRS
jgi:uncharacterized membrane protein